MNQKFYTEYSDPEFRKIIRSELLDILQNDLKRNKEKELLNSDQLCSWLGISISTLNVWKRENRIPYKKMGRRVFFSKQEVLQALQDSSYKRLKELR